MKVLDKDNGVLVLRGQGWLNFALLVLATCGTPFFVWVTIQFELWKALPFAALVPVLMLVTYRRQYKNWQLILEADFGNGTFYVGRWLNRQTSARFDLAKLEKAAVLSKKVFYRDRNLREKYVTEHYLTLEIAGRRNPLTIGIGRYTDVRRLTWSVNNWLDRYGDQSRNTSPNSSA